MSDLSIKVIMMPRDANGLGNILGGVILYYMDQAGVVAAKYHACHEYVTVSINDVLFHNPIWVDDIVSVYTDILSIGTSSITVQVNAYAERTSPEKEKVHAVEAKLTFVALNNDRKPTPILADQKNSEGKA